MGATCAEALSAPQRPRCRGSVSSLPPWAPKAHFHCALPGPLLLLEPRRRILARLPDRIRHVVPGDGPAPRDPRQRNTLLHLLKITTILLVWRGKRTHNKEHIVCQFQ